MCRRREVLRDIKRRRDLLYIAEMAVGQRVVRQVG